MSLDRRSLAPSFANKWRIGACGKVSKRGSFEVKESPCSCLCRGVYECAHARVCACLREYWFRFIAACVCLSVRVCICV